MGLMLTFMFFWNMIGALFFLPALAWLFRIERKWVVTTDPYVAADT
jgi:hypothetical protein